MSEPGERVRATVLGPTEYVYEGDAGPEVGRAEDAAARRPQPRGSGEGRPSVRELPPTTVDRAAGQRRLEAVVDGWRFEVVVEPARRAALRDRAARSAAGSAAGVAMHIRAQIPGRVVAVPVESGAAVEAGDRLLSIEAMKMENEVRAPRAGTIRSVAVIPGQRVELGEELLVLE